MRQGLEYFCRATRWNEDRFLSKLEFTLTLIHLIFKSKAAKTQCSINELTMNRHKSVFNFKKKITHHRIVGWPGPMCVDCHHFSLAFICRSEAKTSFVFNHIFLSAHCTPRALEKWIHFSSIHNSSFFFFGCFALMRLSSKPACYMKYMCSIYIRNNTTKILLFVSIEWKCAQHSRRMNDAKNLHRRVRRYTRFDNMYSWYCNIIIISIALRRLPANLSAHTYMHPPPPSAIDCRY